MRKLTAISDDEVEFVVKKYSNDVFRLCFSFFANKADSEDATADTFLKYISKAPTFEDENRRKAWLLRVASNVCKDTLRFKNKRKFINWDDISELVADKTAKETIEEFVCLPPKYRTVIWLFYIEGYKTDEIAKILKISPAAVRKRLQYARSMLRAEYEKEGFA